MRKDLTIVASIFALTAFIIQPGACAEGGRLDRRLESCASVIDSVFGNGEKGLPADLLGRCSAIAIFPNTVKSGFVVGERYGQGALLMRDAGRGVWSQPAFFMVSNIRWRFELGWQTADIVMIFFGGKVGEKFMKGNIVLGRDIKFIEAHANRPEEAIPEVPDNSVAAYTLKRSQSAPAAIKKALMIPNNAANRSYYDSDVTRREIFAEGGVSSRPSAQKLVDAVSGYTK